MSLKAKIEAVIYAAEEPVTLPQLVSLLGHEAQAELDRITSAQQTLALAPEDPDAPPPPSEPDLLNDEILRIEDDLSDVNPEQSSPESPTADLAEQGSALEPTSLNAEAEPSTEIDPKTLARDERDRARNLRDFLRSLLDQLIRDYTTSDRGLEIREVAGGFRLATKPEYHDAVRGFVKSLKPPLKLTLQALETLAVVAYKQPVTAPEISEIRGVDSGGVLGSLMARKLITTAGRKQVIGRPILYKTTKDFLLRFGLKDVSELPSIEEFEKMAGELAETDPILPDLDTQSQDPEQEAAVPRSNQDVESSISAANFEEEKDATEPQADGDGSTLDTITPDGRMSGISPQPDPANDTDTSREEAEIQSIESHS